MARRRRSFFFDNISKRLLTNTTNNTRQSKDEKDAGTTTNTQITTLSTVQSTISNTNLQDLLNVTITSPSNTEILTYNGNVWVNRPAPQGFSGAYADLTGKPSLFSGAYADLTGKPSLFSGSYSDLTNVPSGLANTLYVDDAVAAIVNSAPTTLNTLDELAAALGDDDDFAATTATSLGNRLRIDVSNQSLSSTQRTNALTNLGITATVAELNKLDGVTATTAELNYVDGVTSNIQTQLNSKGTSSFSGAYADLTGKPTIPTNNNQLTNGAGYITSSSLSSYATSTDLTDGTITKINSEATVGNSIEFFQNDGGGNLGIRFNANYNNSVEDGSAWEFQFNNDSTSGDFLIYYDGSISAADEAISWVEGLRLDGGDSQLYVFGDKVWDAGNLTNLNQLTNGPGYITGITSSMVTTALGYTPGTSSFSGSYNDLSNKPTIPTNNNQLTNGAGYITSSSLSGYVSRTFENSSRNLIIPTNSTSGSGGIALETSNGAWLFQLYGTGTSYGFLQSQWGAWDIQKAVNGQLQLRVSGTDYTVYHTGNLPTIPTNNNQLTNGAGYITSTSASSLTVGNGTNTATHIAIKPADDGTADDLQFYNGTTRMGEIGTQDTTWLRINQSTAKNIYTPRYIRADGGFFIDGTAKGLDGSGNLIGGMSVTAGAGSFTSISSSGSITGNDLRSNRYIYAATDTNTYIDMQVAADTIRVVCGGGEVFRVGPNYVELQDSDTLRLGAGSDFRMWHNGTDHYFRNYNHSGGNIYWQGEDAQGDNHALLYMYTAVSRPYLSLYENSGERMRTTSAGVTTYGTQSATGNICAYSSDARLKTNVVNIENALEKLMSLNGVTFDWKEEVKDLGFNPTLMYNEAGVLAQEVEAVLPQATAPAPFDTEYDVNTGEQISKSGENYLTVQYEKIVPLLIEAMKEQQQQIEDLKEIINDIAK